MMVDILSLYLTSTVDARRLICEGGVYINHRRVQEPEFLLVMGEHILPNKITLLRLGKENK